MRDRDNKILQVCKTNETTKQYFKETHKLTNQQNSPNKN